VGAGSLWPTSGGRLQEGQGDGSIGGENILGLPIMKNIFKNKKMQRKPRNKEKGERKTPKNDFLKF